jgi:hypothetical protein
MSIVPIAVGASIGALVLLGATAATIVYFFRRKREATAPADVPLGANTYGVLPVMSQYDDTSDIRGAPYGDLNDVRKPQAQYDAPDSKLAF